MLLVQGSDAVWAQEREKKVKSVVEFGSLYHWNWAASPSLQIMETRQMQIASPPSLPWSSLCIEASLITDDPRTGPLRSLTEIPRISGIVPLIIGLSARPHNGNHMFCP